MDLLHAPPLDFDALAPVVRQALRSDTAVVDHWGCTELHHGSGGGGVFLVEGTARDHSQGFAWSVVLKTLHREDGDFEPGEVFYWKREPLLYSCGLFEVLSPYLAVPKTLGTTVRSEEEIWLWLEVLPDAGRRSWSEADYLLVARHLGRFNAASLVQDAVPAYEWLSRGILQRWLQDISALPHYLDEFSNHEFVRRALPGRSREQVLRLIPAVGRLLRALRSLPQTFCHLDCHTQNVMLRLCPDGGAEPVLLDWALAGLGALGQDLAPLLTVSAFKCESDIRLEYLDARVFDAYMQGLQDVGWWEDPRIVRLGYGADAVLRFLNRTRFLLGLPKYESARAWWERVTGRPIEHSIDRFAAMLPYMFSLADETSRLLDGG